jgi:hypothetical protein
MARANPGRPRRLWLIACPLALVAALACAAALYARHDNSPVSALPPMPAYGKLPASVAVAHAHLVPIVNGPGQLCSYRYPLGRRRKVVGAFRVDPHPASGRVLWLPGMSTRPCRAWLSRLKAAQAEAFVTAVRRARPSSTGMYGCGPDDGSTIVVLLNYSGKPQPEVVTIPLGCGYVTAPGRTALLQGSVRRLLSPYPPPFRQRHG